MDKDELLRLLQASQIPDTEKVKAVTSELQKNYFSQPQSLLLLIEITITHSDGGIRQLAALQAARIAKNHWKKITEDQKAIARQHLLEGTLKESLPSTRRSLARLIAVIAGLELDTDEGKNFLRSIISLNTSADVTSREVGSYIVYALLDNDPVAFSDHIQQLLELFSTTIRDAESKDVCVNTIKGLGALLIVIEPDEDEKALAAIQKLFPPMVQILRDAIQTESSEHYGEIFETLQGFLAYDPALLNAYLLDLISFMVEIASNTQIEDDARSQAIAFLSQAVHARRMKIQAMKEVPGKLMTMAIKIVVEMEDDMLDDDMDELSAVRTAIALIDQLATDLPPRLVINPLLDDFPKMVTHDNPAYRRAGIIALGTAAEGAPDFISTQLKKILPLIVNLLNDPDESVRHASLVGLIQLADEMGDEFAPKQEEIMTALLKNLQEASQNPTKKNIGIIRGVCGALNALGMSNLDDNIAKNFGQQLLGPLGALLPHEDFGIKAAAASAIGSIALSLDEAFMPYFKEVMAAFAPYLTLKEGSEPLALRAAVVDSMGDIASAVGAEAFQPYVMDLMKSSEEGLSLDNANLKETSFLLWGGLARLYKENFSQFLPGVFQGLLAALELEEEELAVDGLVEGASEGDVLLVGGKKLRLKKGDDETVGMDDDSEGWTDLKDFGGVTAEALQQEVAIEVLGDVIMSSCDMGAIKSYLEPTLEKLKVFHDHTYEGCRKATLSTLWRIYSKVWELMGEKSFKPGPAKDHPIQDPALRHIAEIVVETTLQIWADDPERVVVTVINQNCAEVLKTCGPAILGVKDFEKQIAIIIAALLTRCHPCQQDFGDDADVDLEGGVSEFDWLVVDTTLDVIIGMAAAMGEAFAPHFMLFIKPVIKLASSQESLERAAATGALAEVVKYLGTGVTPFTAQVGKILAHRLTDQDALTKSNAAFGIGQLVYNSQDPAVLERYPDIVEKLEPALSTTGSSTQDNIAGCFARMMMRKPEPDIVAKLLPLVVGVLPLKEDFEENVPIFECIYKLYDLSNPTVQELTPQLIPVFRVVLGEPEKQLDDQTREMVTKTVQALRQAKPELFQ